MALTDRGRRLEKHLRQLLGPVLLEFEGANAADLAERAGVVVTEGLTHEGQVLALVVKWGLNPDGRRGPGTGGAGA